MLRQVSVGLFVVATGVAVVFALRHDPTQAQPAPAETPPAVRQPAADAVAAQPDRPLKPIQPLPVTQVVLFNSGVGYFQREGHVEGDSVIELQFAAADINDLIKSLVLSDPNGKVMPLRYDSQEPIEKTLRSFALDLSSNPSFGELLYQARGEKVELTLHAGPAVMPNTLSGIIIGMESQPKLGPSGTPVGETELLNLLCPEGIRSIPLTQVSRLRFLNPMLESEFRRALEVVARGHDSQKKAVRVHFKGEGKRAVRIGYVVENPIWKTSYRLLLDKKGPAKLLGWAAIENTSDEDWNNVKLTLVSGRPISFQMDLYPPLFLPRPTVEPELFASLRPPAYAGPLSSMQGMALANAANLGFAGAGLQGPSNSGIQVNPAMGQLGNLGSPVGTSSGTSWNRFQNLQPNSAALANRLTYQELQQRRSGRADPNHPPKSQTAAEAKENLARIGNAIANLDREAIEAALAAGNIGHPSRYPIEEKVTLPRQQSALLPILETPIEGSRVSIYNPTVHALHPLLGLKFKNTTKQALMQGPIAVYDEGVFAGDARILDLQPDEERLISYAVDLATEVKTLDRVEPSPEMTVSLRDGTLHVQYRLRATRSYVIHNRSGQDRTVILEQPVREGWKLVEPAQPAERTRDLYRFVVPVKAGESAKWEVAEEQPRLDPFTITRNPNWNGFSTTLGLDVWTEQQRTPEDQFGLELVRASRGGAGKTNLQVQAPSGSSGSSDDRLWVTHKDRRTIRYFLRNRSTIERKITLEHVTPTDRVLSDATVPPIREGSIHRYRFELKVPAGQTIQQAIIEERQYALPETFTLTSVPTAAPRPGSKDPPVQRFVTELGFEVWTEHLPPRSILTEAKIVQGGIVEKVKWTEQMILHIRNRTAKARTYQVEHVVRPDWTLQTDAKPVEGAGQRYRFAVNVAADATGQQAFLEHQTVSRERAIAKLKPDELKELLESPIVSDAVKRTIRQGYELSRQMEALTAAIDELTRDIKSITDEQERIRSNLEKLPRDSAIYNRLLEKMDKTESSLEAAQQNRAKKQNELRALRTEYETTIATANVE